MQLQLIKHIGCLIYWLEPLHNHVQWGHKQMRNWRQSGMRWSETSNNCNHQHHCCNHAIRGLHTLSHHFLTAHLGGEAPISHLGDLKLREMKLLVQATQPATDKRGFKPSLPNHRVQFSLVAQSCLTLGDPMDCSMPGFPVHHQLLELAQTHVPRAGDAIQHSLFIPSSSCLYSFPAWGSFPVSQFFTSGGQSIRVSASASVLSMNIRDDFL